MNDRFESLMYHAGMTAQGCWDDMDSYQREAIEKFAQLIVKECMDQCSQKGAMNNYLDYNQRRWYNECAEKISRHFGVKA